MDFNCIKLVVVDVDGTLTDGGLYYDNHQNEFKKFNTKDAAGFFAAKEAGIKTMLLTGRKCEATERRAKEFKVDYVVQNCRSKAEYLHSFFKEKNISPETVVYIGDDLNDMECMMLCGYSACPADACREVREYVDHQSSFEGGKGAVRDIIEYILQQCGKWEHVTRKIYGAGI